MSQIVCSIIIPTFNTAELTLRCIQEIRRNPPKDPYEIIVVDNASNDHTSIQISQYDSSIRVITNTTNLGYAKACNIGAKVASGTYLCFLNSDTLPLKDSFQILVNWLKSHSETGIVGPELLSKDQTVNQMSWGWKPILHNELLQKYFSPQAILNSPLRKRLIRFLQRKPRQTSWICGACIMIRKETFFELDGFDEEFELYFEDVDLSNRCTTMGWRVEFIPDSKIIHFIGQSMGKPLSITSLIYQQSHVYYYKKHASRFSQLLLKIYLKVKVLSLCCSFGKNMSHKQRSYLIAFQEMTSERRRFSLHEGLPQ